MGVSRKSYIRVGPRKPRVNAPVLLCVAANDPPPEILANCVALKNIVGPETASCGHMAVDGKFAIDLLVR